MVFSEVLSILTNILYVLDIHLAIIVKTRARSVKNYQFQVIK